MLELSRTVRCCLSRSGRPASPDAFLGSAANAFSAHPPMRGLGRYYEWTVACRGEADPVTGYFINIKEIDAAVRGHVLPHVQGLIEGDTPEAELAMGGLMREAIARLQGPLGGTVALVELALTPRLRLGIERHAMDRVTLRQQYEFSAAHRLHSPGLSDEENRGVFGKCNNPAGHGHNYVVEVLVEAEIAPDGRTLEPEALDRVVDDAVIERLDHKHLNLDVPEFESLNPSVEHIVRVVWAMLEPRVAEARPQAPPRLVEVRVWETGKTACAYRGPVVGAAV